MLLEYAVIRPVFYDSNYLWYDHPDLGIIL